jgi:hypothetical protein
MTDKPRLETWEYRDSEDFKRAAQLNRLTVEDLTPPSAVRGDSGFELHSCIVDLHRTMRVNYQRMIHQVGRNIYPLILAKDNLPDTDRGDIGRQGLGGTYTLYLANGENHSVRPTPRAYETMVTGTTSSPSFSQTYHANSVWRGARYGSLKMLQIRFQPMELTNELRGSAPNSRCGTLQSAQ